MGSLIGHSRFGHPHESEFRMRLRAAALSLLVVPAVVAVAACGSGGNSPSSGASSDTTSPSASSEPSDSATSPASTSEATTPTAGPAIPADTAVASPVPRGEMPQATGGFGDKPTITMPSTPPPPNLQRVVLSKGAGPVSNAGDWLTVNYLGQVWGGKVFDNSYDRGTPFTVQVGGPQPQVVAGWDVGLQGVQQGSRVLLSFPPQDGYGAAGRAPDITGTDTLVFVVDVIKVYGANAGGDPAATPEQIPTGWPTVGGKLGALPTISVPKTLPDPTTAGMTIVAKGHGAPAQAGDVLVQYVAMSWDGTQTEQSWPDPTGKNHSAGAGPASFPLSTSSPFASLVGVPLGSRVLLRTPADSNSGVPAVAWVVDLIAQQNVTPSGGGASGGAPGSTG